MFDEPIKVMALMCQFEFDWGVAGGWAIDLFLETETRAHDDIEIAIFRRDQMALREHLDDWTFKKVQNHALFDWQAGEVLEFPVHEIHCSRNADEPHFIEVLMNERNETEWIYRRNTNVKKPISEVFSALNSGIKFLRPEIVLLYKSKNPRPKDERDFRAAMDKMDVNAKLWLKDALAVCYVEHAWLKML